MKSFYLLFASLLYGIPSDWESLPAEVVRDACQLTKHNSIEGSKQTEVTIVYTPAYNLKKKPSMDTGQVGFKDHTKVKYVQHVKRDKELLKKLEKTKTEADINLEEMKRQRDRKEREMKKQQQKLQQEKEQKERQEMLDLKTYKALTSLTPTMEYKGDGTIDSCRQIEEDFL